MSGKSIADQHRTNKPDFDIVTHAGEHVGVRMVGVLDGHPQKIDDLQLSIVNLCRIVSSMRWSETMMRKSKGIKV